MSQIVYTELEGQPLRWVYKGTVPRERTQEADRTPKTWSVSTTPTTQIQSANTGIANAVHGPNMLAQVFQAPANATKITGVQLYGNKVGSPPNPLSVEVRKFKVTRYTTTLIDAQLGSTGEKTLLRMKTNLPAGGKNIIIAAFGPNGMFSSTADVRFRIKKGATILYETNVPYEKINGSDTYTHPVIIMAIDDNPAGGDEYSFAINVTYTGTTGPVHVQGMVIKAEDAKWAYNTTEVTINANATATITSTTTNYSSERKIVALAYVYLRPSSGWHLMNAGNIRIKLDNTIIVAHDFPIGVTSGGGAYARIPLAWCGTVAAGSKTWSIEVANNTSVALTAYALLVVFPVDDGAILDTSATTLTNGSQVTLGTLSTTLSGDIAAIGLTAIYNTSATTVTAANAGDVVFVANGQEERNVVQWSIYQYSRSGILPLFTIIKNATNPSFEARVTARATGLNGEAKIVAFRAQAETFGSAVGTVEDTILASTSIAPASVGTSAGWINIPFSGSNIVALRPGEFFVIVVYTIGGDASNYYAIHSSSTPMTQHRLAKSTNSGGSWSIALENLSFRLDGVQYVRLYSGSIQNNIVTPLGKVVAALIVEAQTSGSMEFTGFDDHMLAAPIVTSTASSQTLITVLRPEDPRHRDVLPSEILNWEIWAAGTGLAVGAYTQRYTYYTANPVFPRDFGFGELYLIADEIPPQGLVVLNDNTAAALYNPSTTATRVDTYELFRVPVRKIEVIQEPTSGNIILYLIGLP